MYNAMYLELLLPKCKDWPNGERRKFAVGKPVNTNGFNFTTQFPDDRYYVEGMEISELPMSGICVILHLIKYSQDTTTSTKTTFIFNGQYYVELE